MDIHTFIANYQEAFGQHAELPIAFWYSDRMGASTEKVTGCLFKCMKQVRDGKIVSLSNKQLPAEEASSIPDLQKCPSASRGLSL